MGKKFQFFDKFEAQSSSIDRASTETNIDDIKST